MPRPAVTPPPPGRGLGTRRPVARFTVLGEGRRSSFTHFSQSEGLAVMLEAVPGAQGLWLPVWGVGG